MLLNLSEKFFHWWFCAISDGPTTSLARSFAISLPPIPTARSSFPTPLCPLSYSFFSPNQNRIWQPWRQWAPFTSFLSLMSRIALLQGMWFPYSAADSVRLGWDCSLVPLRASPKDYFPLLRRFSTNAWILLSLHQRSKNSFTVTHKSLSLSHIFVNLLSVKLAWKFHITNQCCITQNIIFDYIL